MSVLRPSFGIGRANAGAHHTTDRGTFVPLV